MKFILGRKLNMTQVFEADGRVIPVTAVLAEPNVITQVRTMDTDKYSAVQLGFGVAKKLKKAQAGHLSGINPVKVLREVRVDVKEIGNLKRGDVITVETFEKGNEVRVTGKSKGKGFQGVVKRHGFHGSPATHGHKDQLRMPGSIGATAGQRVLKGTRMAGHMGDEQITVTGLEIVEVDIEKNILYVKGAVPGARNGMLMIVGPGEIKVKETIKPEEIKIEAEDSKEEIAEPVVAEEKIVAEETAQPIVEVESAETKTE